MTTSHKPGAGGLWGSPAPDGAADWAAAGPAAGGSGGAAPAGPFTPAASSAPGAAGLTAASGATAGLGEGQSSGAAARTWTVVLPPLELLNANHRLHRMQAAKLTKAIREAGGWCTRAAKVPRLARARIDVELRFWEQRRRDPANWAPSLKAATDGVVDAGVLDDDDDAHLDGPYPVIGRIDPDLAYVTSVTGKRVRQARLVLHITELPEVTP